MLQRKPALKSFAFCVLHLLSLYTILYRIATSTLSTRMGTKIVKHNPDTKLRSKTALDTTFLVKGSTPFVSAVKRIDRMLEKFDTNGTGYRKYLLGEYKKVRFLTIKGMGKAIDTVVSLGLHYKHKKQYKVDVKTGTVEVLDELKKPLEYSTKESDDEESEFKKRRASYVDVKIWLKRNT